MPQMGKPCDSCGKEVVRYPSQFKRYRHVFCCGKCQGDWIRAHEAGKNHHNWTGHTITCAQCGKVKQRSPSIIKGQHQFCGHACRGRWLSENAEQFGVPRKDANHEEIADALREAGCSVMDTSSEGNGFPDMIVCNPKRVGVPNTLYLLEVKNPHTTHGRAGLSPAQEAWNAEWGNIVNVVESVEDALIAVGAT